MHVIHAPRLFPFIPFTTWTNSGNLKAGGRSPFPENGFTGSVLGYVLIEFLAPKGLKGSATAV